MKFLAGLTLGVIVAACWAMPAPADARPQDAPTTGTDEDTAITDAVVSRGSTDVVDLLRRAVLAQLAEADRWPTTPRFEPLNDPKSWAPRGTLLLSHDTTYQHTGDALTPIYLLPATPDQPDAAPPSQGDRAYTIWFDARALKDTSTVTVPTPAGAAIPPKALIKNPDIARDVGRTTGCDDRYFRRRIEPLKLGQPRGATITKALRTSTIVPGILRVERVVGLDDINPSETWIAYPLVEANGPARFDGYHRGNTTTFEIPITFDPPICGKSARVPLHHAQADRNPHGRNRQALEYLAISQRDATLDTPIIWIEQLHTRDYPRIAYHVHAGIPPIDVFDTDRVIAAIAVFDTVSNCDLATLLARCTARPDKVEEIERTISEIRDTPRPE
ncbi:MAG: hypothetical protein Tsb0013_17000 [Phycisphaerales bacterium]